MSPGRKETRPILQKQTRKEKIPIRFSALFPGRATKEDAEGLVMLPNQPAKRFCDTLISSPFCPSLHLLLSCVSPPPAYASSSSRTLSLIMSIFKGGSHKLQGPDSQGGRGVEKRWVAE